MADISLLIKPSSGLCNMRCDYCFYHDEALNREKESYGFMSLETLENIIKKSVDFASHSCSIVFQGGEPTLRGLAFFEEAVRLQKQYGGKDMVFHNSIQTNGSLLDKQWVEFFKKNNFLVGISLDGTAFTHDYFRKDKEGEGTCQRVMQSIQLLREYEVEYNILTVVNALTARKISRIYLFYRQMGFEYLQFIPCLNPMGKEEKRYEYTITPKQYGHFLKELFDLWYRDVLKGEEVHIQTFEEYVRILLLLQPNVCGMTGVCSCQHAIEADGEVYPCDFYVLDDYRLGNLNRVSFEEINERRKETGFIEESAFVNEKCRTCRYFAICRGGCRRYRVPENIFCSAYYDFFEYSIKRLEEAALIYKNRYML